MPGKFDIGPLGDMPSLSSVGPSLLDRGETIVANIIHHSPPATSYEVHINVPLCAGPGRVLLAEFARSNGFKLSDMDGHEHGEKRETILTTHGQHYDAVVSKTQGMCRLLRTAGFDLIRYKIEHVLIDSRVNDVWGLL